MHAGRAFIVGVAGALAMTVVMSVFRAAGIPLGVEAQLAARLGLGIWAVGLAAHLLIGGGIAIAYAFVFEYVLHQSGVGPGMLLGACNAIFAGFVWAALGGPGGFWHGGGPLGVMALFLAFLSYGAVVGGLYRSEQVPIYG